MEFPGQLPVVLILFAAIYWLAILGGILFVVWTVHRMRLALEDIARTLTRERR